jgi:hypothetical protein
LLGKKQINRLKKLLSIQSKSTMRNCLSSKNSV